MCLQSDCIFCKIVAGTIPSATIFENDDVIAFLDISQTTKGHTLVIPKQHATNIFDLTSETSRALGAVLPMLANALQTAFEPKGLNIVNNNGEAAGQTVFHYHVHLIPRYDHNDGFQARWTAKSSPLAKEEFVALAQTIKQHVSQ
ncbi:MAG: HIT family protein [Bacilli bacterium]